MTDLGSAQGALRAVPPETTAQPASTTELFRLEATRAGDRVAQLRALSTDNGYVVECDVAAVDGRRVELRPTLVHPFGTHAELKAFLDEAAAALQYLGCHVRGGSV